MFRRSVRGLGSYILNQRVVPDWWQPYHRDDAHAQAKSLLASAVRRDHDQVGDGDSARAAAASAAASSYDGYGDSQSSFAHAAGGESAVAAAAPALTLYDLNALVASFTSNHDIDELSTALEYLREQLGRGLSPFHYHALFRVFNHGLDKENALQLLDVMAQRGETTQETYARAIDCVHCLAPTDALSRVLEIVAVAQTAFGTLASSDTCGSEAATVAAYGAGRERYTALKDANALPGSPAGSSPLETAAGEQASSAPRSSPVLTALLHHVANSSASNDPVAALLVAVWIRALGVRLGDWDTVHVATTLLTRAEEFPRVRALLASFPDSPRGSVSPAAVLRRLEERGERARASEPLAMIADAMSASLTAAAVDLEAPVAVGFVNAGLASLRGTVLGALQSPHSLPDGCTGLGPHGYNAALLHHTLALAQSALRDDAAAARSLIWAVQAVAAAPHRTAAAAATEEDVDDGDRAEPQTIGFPFMLDVGSLLPRLSAHDREELRKPFTTLAQSMAMHDREGQLEATLGGTSSASPPLAVAVSRCAVAPPVQPNAEDLIGLECYTLGFIKSYAEAHAALQRAVARVERGRARLGRHSRLAFMQLAQFCCDHPVLNPKLTPAGLAERRKWGAYLDARDTSLALFGSSRLARDSMKHIYYGSGQLPALRTDDAIQKDFVDCVNALFSSASPSADTNAETADDDLSFSSGVPPRLRSANAYVVHRSTQPHVRCPPHVVPPHLYDPDVHNPYPHVALRIAPATLAEQQASADALLRERGSGDDLFAELWRTLMNPAIMGNDVWYLRNPEMYLLLMRCLLHRLDWEAAAHLTAKMQEHSTYTYLMDHELTTIFREIGDPAGCLAFKVATKLFDGRITRDGQTKRDRFHQEQFQ